MKNSRRIKRMSRSNKKVAGLSLVSLMDVFTILVFFLLTNSASDEVLSNPKEIALPDSVVESKPRETIVIFVSPETLLFQGEPIMKTNELLASKKDIIVQLRSKLLEQKNNIIGTSTKAAVDRKEVTLLADKKIPFKVLKKIMSTCTSAGFSKISLAVIQKASQS